MKTLILYATKYGAAGEIAQRIADKIGGSVMHNLKHKDVPSLDDFGCVIIGSSVYAGSIRKEARKFIAQNATALQEKQLGIFLSGIGADGEQRYLESNFPAALLQKAKAAQFLGGIFDPQKADAFERFIIKMISKSSALINVINDHRIDQFAQAMSS